ncbi:gamma-glutamyl-gamma-aminobutyrate hydrolase family protein [Kordiimonas pumila]|uniref:Gamma-glutamyl-gamma-aminobutyrate hydrolase family protein n=1 Tax=Kordiimonas pumila TaxID=2161677 RepID=A0ABV7D2S0_9PROT|nr:gamma-glutamyl-gamma-aminobutyrate hydrolase family protein [Kordiimonas pumila]
MPRLTPRTKRPLIGITTGNVLNSVALWSLRWSITMAGGRPIRISPSHNVDMVRELNGLVVSGGNDINPALYGHPNTASHDIDPHRDRLERECVEMAYLEQLPILGVCRGAQMINIVLGGTLHQDAPSIFDGFLPTQSTFAKIFARRKVFIDKNSRLINILENNPELWVNSLHHQAMDTLGKGLRKVAADDQGIVQAIEDVTPDHFVLGVQWHPEFMLYSSPQRKIFKTFVRASSTGCRVPDTQGAPVMKGVLTNAHRGA